MKIHTRFFSEIREKLIIFMVLYFFILNKLLHTRNNTLSELFVTFFLNLHRLFTLLLPAPGEKAKAFSNKSL